ncbi:MAG: aminopeptidase P family protein, partial [Bifidobacteriaceae bacterium]|nr:aminopeptidase P family protein [Bifidobacteriaceae bacterium]
MSEQPLEQRGTNRSVKPKSDAFREFIAGQWAEPPAGSTEPLPSSGPGARRRAALGAEFPGERLVIPAGAYKI